MLPPTIVTVPPRLGSKPAYVADGVIVGAVSVAVPTTTAGSRDRKVSWSDAHVADETATASPNRLPTETTANVSADPRVAPPRKSQLENVRCRNWPPPPALCERNAA